jgi:hypothetical protein
VGAKAWPGSKAIAAGEMQLANDETIGFRLEASGVYLFDPDTGGRIR